MADLFDPYELRARLAPTLIVALPLLIAFSFCVPHAEQSLPELIGSGVVGLALLYGLTFAIRFLGRGIEPQLWQSWGGAPSTRVLRWGDSTLSRELKIQIHGAVLKAYGIRFLSEAEERTAPHGADKLIDDVFRRVREELRLHDKNGLWLVHNAEYGFARNLLGCRKLFLLLCGIALVGCGLLAKIQRRPFINLGTVLNSLMIVLWFPFGWWFVPRLARETAIRYAERAWLAFLALVSTPGRTASPEK